jgi:hypothetical protein
MDLLHYILFELNQYFVSVNTSVQMTDSIGYNSILEQPSVYQSIGVEETVEVPIIEFPKNDTRREM